ncbi:MAG: hypothetical protein ABJB01_01165 [Rudaea sp.]
MDHRAEQAAEFGGDAVGAGERIFCHLFFLARHSGEGRNSAFSFSSSFRRRPESSDFALQFLVWEQELPLAARAGNFLFSDKKSPKNALFFAESFVRRQHIHVLAANRGILLAGYCLRNLPKAITA